MSLQFKEKAKRVRLVFSDGPGQVMPEHAGKVFAVIGPFDDFSDKADLRDMLEVLLRGYNIETSSCP
jgi:hypothetical protein